MVWLPLSSPVHNPNLSDQNALGERGGSIVYVHACVPASMQPLSSWELSRIQRPEHSTVRAQAWRAEGVSKNSMGYTADLRGICLKYPILMHFPPMYAHTTSHHGSALQCFSPHCHHSTLKSIQHNMKASYDSISSKCGVSFTFPWGVILKSFALNKSTYLVNLVVEVSLPLRHQVHSAVVVPLHFALIWALTMHSVSCEDLYFIETKEKLSYSTQNPFWLCHT